MGRRGRRENRDEEEIRIIEKAMEMIEEVGFERAMLLLYEAAMGAERKEYQEKHPEDSSSGYYRRRVKIFGKEEKEDSGANSFRRSGAGIGKREKNSLGFFFPWAIQGQQQR